METAGDVTAEARPRTLCPTQERVRPHSIGAPGRLPNRFIPLQTEAGGAERRSPRTRADSVEGREAARRRVDWELEIESLGRRETELHRNQLRLVREQAATFLRDLKALQSEVMTLRSRQDALHQDCLTAAELRTQEVKDAVETERREREGTNLEFSQRFTGLEADVAGSGNAINSMRQQVREVEVTVVSPLQELKEALSKEVAEREVLAGSVQRFCGDLTEKIARGHEELQGAADIRRTSTDKEHAALDERMNSLETNFRGMEAHRTALEDSLRQVRLDVDTNNSTLTQRLFGESTSRASIQDHLCYLERLLSDSSNKQTADVEATSASLEQIRSRLASCESYKAKQEIDLAKLHSFCNDLDGRLSSFEDRAFLLESHAKSTRDEAMSRVQEHAEHLENLTIVSDEYMKELEALKGSMDSQQISLKERFANLEKALSDFSGARERDLQAEIESVKGSIHQHASALERERTLREEADAEHVAALEKMSTSQAHEKLQERVIVLETTSQETLKKRAEDSSELTIEMERLRERVSNCEAHKEGLSSLEALQRDLATRHLASVQELESLRSAQLRLDGEAKLRDTRQSSLSERLERLDEFTLQCGAALREEALLKGRVEAVEASLSDFSSRQHKEMEAVRVILTRQDAELADVRHTHEFVEEQLTTCQSKGVALEDRLSPLEFKVKQTLDDMSKELAEKGTMLSELGKLVEEHVSKQKALTERIGLLDQSVVECRERHAAEAASLRNACERHSEELESVRKAASSNVSDAASTRSGLNEAREELAAASSALQAQAREVNVVLVSLESLRGKVEEERVAREAADSALADSSAEALVISEKLKSDLDEELHKAAVRFSSIEAGLSHSQDHALTVEKGFIDFANRQEEQFRSLQDSCSTWSGEERAYNKKLAAELEQALQSVREEVKLLGSHHGVTADRLDKLGSDSEAASMRHTSLEQQLGHFKRFADDLAGRHEQAIEEMRTTHLKHGGELSSLQDRLEKVGLDSDAATLRHTSLEQQLAHVKHLADDVAGRHDRAIEEMRTIHLKHGGDLSSLQAEQERLVGETSSLFTRIDSTKDRLDEIASDNKAGTERFTSLSHSLDGVRQSVDGVVARYTADIEKLQSMQSKQAADLATLEARSRQAAAAHREATTQACKALEDRLDVIVLDCKTAAERHTTLAQDLDHIKRSADDAAERRAREFEEMWNAQTKARNELEAYQAATRQSVDSQHQTLTAARTAIEDLRAAVGQDRKASDEALLQIKVEQAHLAGELSSKSSNASERLDELVSNIRDATGRHAALTDEVVLVKRLFHEVSTRQTTEMEEMRAAQVKHTQELDAVQAETLLAMSSHGQALDLARAATEDVKMSVGRDLKAKEEALESLRAEHARLAGETSLLTSSHDSTTERLSQLVVDSEQRQAALAQHLDVITHSADDAARRQLKEIEEVRAVQLTHSRNLEAMQAEARQTADVHGQALAAVRAAHEELRVSVGQDLKAAEEALQCLKADQSRLAVESSSLATRCSKSAEQMANIEGLVGEASRRQGINAETTREKLDQLDSRVCSCESHEARHGSDLATLNNTSNELAERLRSATTRLSVCEDTATSTHDGITSMGKELESLHSLQLRLDGEVKLHQTRQSSLSARMDRTDEVIAQHAALTTGRIETVERTLNTAVDRHHNDVESLRGVLTQHGSELEGAREARSALEARVSSSEARNNAFEDRLTPVETKVQKVAEALAQEEAEVGSKLTALAQEADSHSSKHQTLADTLAAMQDLHSKQFEGVLMRTQSFSEALDREASDIRAVCHRHAEDLELLRKEVRKKIQEESTTREAGDCTLADESAQTLLLAEKLRGDLDEELRRAAAKYSDLEARLSQNQDLALTVEKGFIDFAGKHTEELQALKEQHRRFTQLPEQRDQSRTQQAGIFHGPGSRIPQCVLKGTPGAPCSPRDLAARRCECAA